MKKQIADLWVVNPDYLTHAPINKLPEESIRAISEQMRMKCCYNNAVVAGLELDCDSVVLGFAVLKGFCEGGLPIEHAWIKKGGQHFDPTFDCQSDSPEVDYLSLYEVPLNGYLDVSAMIRGEDDADMAIDLFALRRCQELRHLFDYRRSAA